jgi:hypothetical protein
MAQCAPGVVPAQCASPYIRPTNPILPTPARFLGPTVIWPAANATIQWYTPTYCSFTGLHPHLSISEYRSTKYPNLNPIIAADTTLVRFDVCKKPRSEILASTYYSNRQALATANSATHIRLFSKAFPWTIEIKSPSPITCEGIWDAVYLALQEPIVDSEWGLIFADKDRRKIVEAAAKRREDRDTDKRLKRIDWLGEETLFKGLEQDEEFHKARLFPGTTVCTETYIIKFGKP